MGIYVRYIINEWILMELYKRCKKIMKSLEKIKVPEKITKNFEPKIFMPKIMKNDFDDL